VHGHAASVGVKRTGGKRAGPGGSSGRAWIEGQARFGLTRPWRGGSRSSEWCRLRLPGGTDRSLTAHDPGRSGSV
jgi:hypothetical protein